MEGLKRLIEEGEDVNMWNSVWSRRDSNADGSWMPDPTAWNGAKGGWESGKSASVSRKSWVPTAKLKLLVKAPPMRGFHFCCLHFYQSSQVKVLMYLKI